MQHISTQGWTLSDLLQQGKRFQPIPRSSFKSKDLESQIKHYEEFGIPFIVEEWHRHPRWSETFSIDFCLQYFQGDNEEINVRNVHSRQDKTMPFSQFVEKSRSMATYAEPEGTTLIETERWYGKDIECPKEWEEWLVKERVLPDKFLPEGSNDLFALRPNKNGRSDVETLMCYFGVADTYTPCHKDLCASSGQNLMCYTEENGSSFWFMTKSRDCTKVTKYFQSLKHELDHETHVMSISDLAKAPFDVYIAEQKLGDLVLVPPRSCHQVLNFGGMTIKMSWSRMTLAGLTAALYHELPLYRRVCRPEIYQIKSTVHYTLCNYTQKLIGLNSHSFDTVQKSIVAQELTSVLRLYDHILMEEYSCKGTSRSDSKVESKSPASLQLASGMQTCDFCGADIFQNYFRCLGKSVHEHSEEGFIVCPGCYVEGRTCACRDMTEQECQSFDVLFNARWNALQALTDAGHSVKSFKGTLSLQEQRRFFATPSERSVFHAAFLLHAIRAGERQPSRQCRVKGESHAVPSSWSLNCKKCHASRCYPHLLQGSLMHSMHALLLDPTTVTYHEAHLDGFPDYSKGKKALLSSQMEGSVYPNFKVLMTYNAITFPVCQPVDHRHASLGWYDEMPKRPHKATSKKGREETKEETYVSTDPESEMGHAHAHRSPGSDSQRSVKNHAYVELKQHESKLHLSSPLSSTGEDQSDRDGYDSDDNYSDQSANKVSKPPSSKRKYDTSDIETAGPSYTKVSPSEPRPARGVKKPMFTGASTSHQSNKRLRHSRQNNYTDDNVFAPVFPVGPPTKKRRQDKEQKGRKLTNGITKPKERDTHTFADSLGAAINQVGEGATKIRAGNSSTHDHRRRSESAMKMARPALIKLESSSSHDSWAKTPVQAQTPILVNVADLQDMVAKTTDRVVRQMVGDLPNVLLATRAAVSMMTGYAASGQFVNNNTQLQFSSVNHFAEASIIGNTNIKKNSSGILPSHQTRLPPPTSSAPATKDNSHQQVSKDRTQSGGHRIQSEGSSTFPGRRSQPQAIRKTPSGEDSARRRVIYDGEDESD